MNVNLKAWIFLLAGLVVSTIIVSRGASAAPISVVGEFAQKDGEWNLSGMDCMGAPDQVNRHCLLIDDELKKAQFATLKANELVVGDTLKLFDADLADIVGTPPAANVTCSGGEDSGEMDGEAVAYDDPYFYVIGSHGCSRNSAEYRPETFVLARIEVSGDGSVVGVERTYRVSDLLLATQATGPFFGRDLSDNGISIEALAVADGEITIGLRSPLIEGMPLIISSSVDELFAPGAIPLAPSSSNHEPPQIGAIDAGFRDIELLPDGNLLALTGPSREVGGGGAEEGEYALRRMNTHFQFCQKKVLDVSELGSPEAIEWLGTFGDNDKVLIIMDGSENGRPNIVEFSRKC